MDNNKKYIGFSCAYTPIQLIDAAGFIPFKILPHGHWPDHAGQVLHENLCPNVKRILDRGIAGDLPETAGMIFMNSCDAMRRLADAWIKTRPDDRTVILDLPVSVDKRAASFFRDQLERLVEVLEEWSGHSISEKKVSESMEIYNMLSDNIDLVRRRHKNGTLKEGSGRLQEIFNSAVTEDPRLMIEKLKGVNSENERDRDSSRIPVFLFGNVFPDPEAFALFESAGAEIVADDLCTGSRMFHKIESGTGGLQDLADGILQRPPCARTMFSSNPDKLTELLVENYRESGAKGVILHTVKFCDPYLSRLPNIRKKLQELEIPLLSLEGDCTIRSMGQQSTRIEAFIEMLR